MNSEFMRMAKDPAYRRAMVTQDIKKGDVVYHYRDAKNLAIVVDVDLDRPIGTHRIKWIKGGMADQWVPLYCYRIHQKRSFSVAYAKAFLKYVFCRSIFAFRHNGMQ
tara:strand:+ start:440 stop:760 length:321 start_codon:yes stop_codon:yes gene_type:complete